MEGGRPRANKDPPLPLMGGEQWVAVIEGDFALVSERLRIEKLCCSPLPAFAPPHRESRIILDFGEVKNKTD
ncbi:UNVERIFIED_CONTAM: hypothetical protein Slati_3553700 [Sesamum latifolium]|uniref:Uncharacterized protein n=1 Tax=Sesamum latifolium TaxID=2727402 RepID=A0AAW2UKB5_9LAMI